MSREAAGHHTAAISDTLEREREGEREFPHTARKMYFTITLW